MVSIALTAEDTFPAPAFILVLISFAILWPTTENPLAALFADSTACVTALEAALPISPFSKELAYSSTAFVP